MESIRSLKQYLLESTSVGIFVSTNPWYHTAGVIFAFYVALAVVAFIIRIVKKRGQIVKHTIGAFSNPEFAKELSVVSGDMLAEIIHEEMFGRDGHAYLKNGVVMPTKFIRDKAPALVIDVGANIGLFGMSMEIFGEQDLANSPSCRIPASKSSCGAGDKNDERRRSVSAQRRSASAARKSEVAGSTSRKSAVASSSSYSGRLLPAVRVIGFEPIPETFECCRRNYDTVFAETNKAFPEHASHVYQFGIGDAATTARFHYDPTSSAAASMNLNDMTEAFSGKFIETLGAWMLDFGRYPLQRMHSASSYMWAPLFITFIAMGNALTVRFFPARLVAFIFALPVFVALLVFRVFGAPGAKECECRIVTLPEALKCARADDPDQSIALLKIDVEGAEEQVCNGIDAVTWARVHQAVVEVHDSPDGRLNRLVNMLKAQGFKRITVGEEPLELHKLGKIKTIFATRG